MPCTNCNSTPTTFDVTYFYNAQCNDCNSSDCPSGTTSSKCVSYQGPNLACSGIETNDSIEYALQKIDEQICSIIGDYSTYQFNCLIDFWGSDITQESQFVDAITSYACDISDTLTTFTGTTFPAYQTTVDSRFDAIEGPGLTCASAGITNVDSLATVYSKYCTKFTAIDTLTSLSGVVWDNCFTVVTPPTTIGAAFTTVLDQICQTYDAITTSSLPTFNNTGSCLPDPGSADSLSDTISKIKTRLCQSPTLSNSALTSSCITIPSTDTDLQNLLQEIITQLDSVIQNIPSFDETNFVVTQTDPDNVCSGVTVDLATSLNVDRFVAVNSGDTTPGTLIDKVVAGAGVTLSVVSDQLQISASGTSDSFEVKADTTDTTPGFLIDKLTGDTTSGISVNPNYNSGTEQVDLLVSVDLDTLFDLLLDRLDTNPTLYAKFCSKVAGCPSPCSAPTNIQAVAVATTTTTSTTTTTTTAA